ncbi:MAG TPA: hypothetical protein DCM05_10170 [Elusimicrobia bacterium]|nr:hypothetical protein [Elusimicrobiota bacterium]
MTRLAALTLAALLPACAAAEKRVCAVAGAFYPGEPGALKQTVSAYLAKAPEPPKLPGPVVGLLVPHAGYAYSAPTAAQAYKAVSGAYDTVVVIGAAHTARVAAAALYDGEAFESPLGDVPLERNLIALLLKNKALFEDLPKAHLREHSIEVQLPFLLSRLEPGFKLVPIAMNTEDPSVAEKVGRTLGAALKEKKALLVVSSDLSHYPTGALARKVDRTSLLALERLDPGYFWLTNRVLMARREKDLDCTYCGEASLLAGMAAAKALGADRGVLLGYTNSAETPLGEPGRAVGYAAMAFVRSGRPASSEIRLSGAQKKALLSLVRETIALGLDGKRAPSALSEDPVLNLPSAVFVTLTENGRLRGCIGTTEARGTLKDAVAYGAYSAAFEDHRFKPVTREELPKLHVEVSLLSPAAPVSGHEAVVPKTHGVILSQGGHAGLFLPQVWEQIPRKEEFLGELCSQKAGLPSDCWKDPKTKIQVFTVSAFEEPK